MKLRKSMWLFFVGCFLALELTEVAGAAPLAYVHKRVRERLRERGQTRVLVVMGDPMLPDARAGDWRQRRPAIAELASRVREAAPRLRVIREYEIFPFLAGTVDDIGLRQLAAVPQVEAVYPDRRLQVSLLESGPLIHQPDVEGLGCDGTGVTIAVIDTGIDYTHPDLGGSATSDDFPNAKVVGGTNIIASGYPMDDNGHGTHVAGIAAGTGSDYRGMAPAAALVAVKAFDEDGSGYASDAVLGIQWCILNKDTYGIRVINMSFGDSAEWTDPDECDGEPEGEAVAEAVVAGLVVVAASGNIGHEEGVAIPACATDAMAVGATYDTGAATDTPTSYSNRGELLSVYAPGSWIASTKLGGGYETDPLYQSGTSFAAPHVAGAAALLLDQLGVDTAPDVIRSRIERTGIQVVDPATGVAAPRIDLLQAVNDDPSTGPDLVVTAVSADAESGLVGDSISVSATVQNQGDAAAGASRVIIGLSGNRVASPQDYVTVTLDVPMLGVGESYPTGPADTVVPTALPGEYWVTAFADAEYDVEEQDETNNGRVGASFIVDALSAYVLSTSIPASMLKGDACTVTVTMLNDGTAPWTAADGFVLGAVSPAGTVRWGTSEVLLPNGETVEPGGTAIFTFDVTAPSDVGLYPCHWQMARGNAYFGEMATGSTKTRVVDDSQLGQDYPALSGEWLAFEDARGETGSAVSVRYLTSGGTVTLPDEIPFPLQWDPVHEWYEPEPPYEYFDISYQWLPDISGPWVAWMVDDVPSNPNDPFNSFWYFQIAALNVQDPTMLPVRVTYQYADAFLPSMDGSLVVWEDYRNDADGTMSEDWLAEDNPDIYICDVTDVTGPGDHFPPVYPICTAAGPQFAPRISGDIVVWEDWRDTGGMQSDLYLYDLSVDTDGDGTPNWKESPAQRPHPDPAEVRLTDSTWPEEFPDLSGETMVWMDLRRDTGLATLVDVYARDIYGTTASAVAADAPAYREHPRIDGPTVVWEDWRQAQSDIYWIDLATGVSGPIAGSAAVEDYPDVSGDRVVYAKHRGNVTVGSDGDEYEHAVFNVWIQDMLPGGAVGVHTFSDVPSDFWAWRHVEAAVENAVVQGYPDGTYQPSSVVTRDQMAVYIARALAGGDGNVPVGPPSPSFSDVAREHWAYRYIEYAVAEGVVQGFEDGSYQPGLEVDRAQMAVYIARALAGGDPGVPDGPPSPTFPDIPTDFWAYKYVEYIADAGVTQGYPDGQYHPEILCSRDQMSVYVSRAFDYVE